MAVSLSPGFHALALHLQEAATDLSHSDIRSQLSNAVHDAAKPDGYGYVLDVFGDDESGDVVHQTNGQMLRSPYSFSKVGGVKKAVIGDGVPVTARTLYEVEPAELDHMASMQEAKLYTDGPVPTVERMVSKKERDAADSSDFAGKGKSFPILKPEDVSAAAHSLGRAGSGNDSSATIKKRIIAIAKRKGWTSSLPKAWQESAVAAMAGLQLVESAATIQRIVLKEAKADYEIKLIAPGKGSSAFYPAEVLKRDGPKVFKAGTHVYLNHPTQAEEAQRPEGDVKNLAGVLSTTATYHETHAKGPGLYARMKVFADHGQLVEEKAPHVGMSIRASGNAESGKSKDGLPVLKELTSAESVDVVTRAGAGGMILTESLRAKEKETTEMEEKDVKALVESATKPLLDTIAKLQETLDKSTSPVKALEARALRGDATVEATKALSGLALGEASKQRVIESVLRGELPVKDGVLDVAKFTELVAAEAKREAAYVQSLTGGGRVIGMGTSVTTETDPAKIAEAQKREREAIEQDEKDAAGVFQRFGLTEAAAKSAAKYREVA